MYEEKKSSIPYRDLAIQLLFIVLFVLILLWIFPTKKSMKEYVDKNGDNKTTQNVGNNTTNNGKENNGTNNTGNNGNNAGNNGNNAGSKTPTTLYEYTKVTGGEYGAWSNWSTNKVTASATREVQTEVRNVQTGTKTTQVQTGTKTEKYLVGIVTNNNGNGQEIVDYKEEYVKTENASSVPNSTTEYKYVQIASVTQNGVTTYTYNVYKLTPVYSQTTSTSEVYGEREVPVYETKTEPVYQSVTYYRYREKTNATVDTKWSENQNDASLIADGYQFTGNVKES